MNAQVTPNCRMQCSGCGAAKFWEEVSVLKARIKFKKLRCTALYRTSGCYALLPEGNPQGAHSDRLYRGYSPHMIMSFEIRWESGLQAKENILISN